MLFGYLANDFKIKTQLFYIVCLEIFDRVGREKKEEINNEARDGLSSRVFFYSLAQMWSQGRDASLPSSPRGPGGESEQKGRDRAAPTRLFPCGAVLH